jgi:hypothetical protein
MADPTLKLELPCPRCGMLNSPAALHCRQCAQALEAAVMPDWPQPTPFDLPGASVPCAVCAKPNPAGTETCLHCGEATSGLIEEAVARATRTRPRPKRKVGPLLSNAGWQNMAMLIRLVAVLFLIWSVVDSGFWLSGVTGRLAPDSPLVLRYTTYAIYELLRNTVLVGAVWALTLLRRTGDA